MIRFFGFYLVILSLVPVILCGYQIMQPFTMTEFMKLDQFMRQSYNTNPAATFDSVQDGVDEYKQIFASVEQYAAKMADSMENGIEPTELCEVMLPDLDAYGDELPKLRQARAYGESLKEFHALCESIVFLSLECDRASLRRAEVEEK